MRNFSCDLIIDNGVYEWSVGHNIGLVILPYEELKPNPDISGIGVRLSFSRIVSGTYHFCAV